MYAARLLNESTVAATCDRYSAGYHCEGGHVYQAGVKQHRNCSKWLVKLLDPVLNFYLFFITHLSGGAGPVFPIGKGSYRNGVAVNDILIGILQEGEGQVLQHGHQAGLLVQRELELPFDVGLYGSACNFDPDR